MWGENRDRGQRGTEVVDQIREAGERADLIAGDLDGRGCSRLAPDGDDGHPGDVMMRGTPAGASGSPDATAKAAVYLAGDEAAFVHGTVIDVDGAPTSAAVIAAVSSMS